MDSKEAMKQACKDEGVQNVASLLGLSPAALYNQINDKDRDDILNKFIDFNNACNNDIAIKWACESLNGFYVANSEAIEDRHQSADSYVSNSLKEFGDVIREIGEAVKDGEISFEEAKKIRKEWEELKEVLESFVRKCEYKDSALVNKSSC